MRSRSTLFDLTGRAAIVTGGGQGLGKGMAAGLAGAGAKIVIADLDGELAAAAAEEISAATGSDVTGQPADVTNALAVEALVARAWERHDGIDILVNNVGGSRQFPNTTLPLDDFEAVMRLCVTSALLCSQAVARRWIEQRRRGSIVNIASVYGALGTDLRIYDLPDAPFEGNVAYNSAKGAVLNFTRDLACAWARHGIRVNCISPGPSETERTARFRAQVIKERLRQRIPLGRLGEPADLAGAVVFLSSAASDFVTGHNLVVDGGFSAW